MGVGFTAMTDVQEVRPDAVDLRWVSAILYKNTVWHFVRVED
jgi:hypothetical protein